MTCAYEMAVEALDLAITSRRKAKETIPSVLGPDTIAVEPGSFLAVVEFDLAKYQRKHNSRAVKKHSAFRNG